MLEGPNVVLDGLRRDRAGAGKPLSISRVDAERSAPSFLQDSAEMIGARYAVDVSVGPSLAGRILGHSRVAKRTATRPIRVMVASPSFLPSS
jgi:hypothetical protein